MSAGAVVFARLADVTSAGNRVYPSVLPQGTTYPAITYQQVSATRLHAMGQDSPVVRIRMQLNLWGRTYAEARALAREVETRLSRFRGTVEPVQVLDVLPDNELETYESETQTRRIVQDYSLLLTFND